MIERVARAICAADVTAPHPDAPVLIGMRSAQAWEGRIEMARAAIAAMREPTSAMLAAGRGANRLTDGNCLGLEYVAPDSTYAAMIDAALADEAPNAD